MSNDDNDGDDDDLGEHDGRPSAYEVGYGKPPLHSRFQKGRSGNPAGRKRKADVDLFKTSLNPISDILRNQLMRSVTIKEGDKTIEVSTFDAVVQAQSFSAIKGNRMAQRDVIQMGRLVEAEREQRLAAGMTGVWSYKDRYSLMFEKARREGRPPPNVWPHPRHIEIDLSTCEIVITGPRNPAEHKAWQQQKLRLHDYEKAYLLALGESHAHPRSKSKKLLAEQLRTYLSDGEKLVPAGWNWREDLDLDSPC